MRGQVTVFIILGVLILGAFAIVLYVATSMARPQLPSAAGIVTPQAVQDYVASCVVAVASEGVVLLGRQGGFLLESQGGITDDAEFSGAAYGSDSVSFDVLPPRGDFAHYFSAPPLYPFARFPYVQDGVSFVGFFGLNRLPALFEKAPDGRVVDGSIQESLEVYISGGIDKCVDWSKFVGFSVSSRQKNVSLVLAVNRTHVSGERFFSVVVDWPLNFTYVSGDKFSLDVFVAKVPVRLASVYYFVNGLLNDDIANISYEPVSDVGFDVFVEDVGRDSVVRVVDHLSIIGGSPFEFRFARMNRAPALWFIDVGSLSRVFTGTKVSVDGDVLVIRDVCEGEEYRFDLRGSDPDADAVHFSVDAVGFASSPGPGSFTVYADDGGLVRDYQVLNFDVVQCP